MPGHVTAQRCGCFEGGVWMQLLPPEPARKFQFERISIPEPEEAETPPAPEVVPVAEAAGSSVPVEAAIVEVIESEESVVESTTVEAEPPLPPPTVDDFGSGVETAPPPPPSPPP